VLWDDPTEMFSQEVITVWAGIPMEQSSLSSSLIDSVQFSMPLCLYIFDAIALLWPVLYMPLLNVLLTVTTYSMNLR